MKGTLTDDGVYVDAPARERLYDTRGYGSPDGDGLTLAPVEACYLLHRDDLDSIDGLDFSAFLAHETLVADFVVYADLRNRGYYLGVATNEPYEFTVYPRGKGPWDNAIAHRIRVIDERELIEASSLTNSADTLAIVDEEGEISYYKISQRGFAGNDTYELPSLTGEIVANRVLVWEPPERLHEEGFYGQRLYGRNATSGPVQLSLVEAAYLEACGALDLTSDGTVLTYGHHLAKERFNRRLTVYHRLREQGAVPKTGFKFGADFRVYETFDSVDAMKSGKDHSESLVRVIAPDYEFTSWEISQDVRLAGGVNKAMVFALTETDAIDWCCLRWFSP